MCSLTGPLASTLPQLHSYPHCFLSVLACFYERGFGGIDGKAIAAVATAGWYSDGVTRYDSMGLRLDTDIDYDKRQTTHETA